MAGSSRSTLQRAFERCVSSAAQPTPYPHGYLFGQGRGSESLRASRHPTFEIARDYTPNWIRLILLRRHDGHVAHLGHVIERRSELKVRIHSTIGEAEVSIG
jgi:hypothetical protein